MNWYLGLSETTWERYKCHIHHLTNERQVNPWELWSFEPTTPLGYCHNSNSQLLTPKLVTATAPRPQATIPYPCVSRVKLWVGTTRLGPTSDLLKLEIAALTYMTQPNLPINIQIPKVTAQMTKKPVYRNIFHNRQN